MTKVKKIINIFYWVFVSTLVVIAASVALLVWQVPGGVRFASVQSGSMSPAIRTGSVVVIVPKQNYEIGDVINFYELKKDGNISEYTTTHRVTKIQNVDESIFYATKGDANDEDDGNMVQKSMVQGNVIFSIPFLGYVTSFVRTLYGLIFLVIVPMTLVVAIEVVNIKNEIVKIYKKKVKLA
jgi:signal peptidase